MSAQRSVQGYINCDNPSPDDDTMLTLIETNEQLSLAASKHQRAVLQARRLQGPVPSPPALSLNNPPPPVHAPVPVHPPPSSVSYDAAPQNTYNLPSQPPRSNEAPLLPPVDVGTRDQNGLSTAYDKNELPLPPSLQAGGNRRSRAEPPPEEENPFADAYAAPSGPPPPRRVEDDAPTNGYSQTRGSPTSYNPGYQSTPSYLGRQESSANNLTMHGAAQQQEQERDQPRNNGPNTPEQARRPHRDSDVSPIAERGTVTYRY